MRARLGLAPISGLGEDAVEEVIAHRRGPGESVVRSCSSRSEGQGQAVGPASSAMPGKLDLRARRAPHAVQVLTLLPEHARLPGEIILVARADWEEWDEVRLVISG